VLFKLPYLGKIVESGQFQLKGPYEKSSYFCKLFCVHSYSTKDAKVDQDESQKLEDKLMLKFLLTLKDLIPISLIQMV